MPVLIVDASAVGGLIFGEPQAKEIAEKLSRGPMAAPALIWFELASMYHFSFLKNEARITDC